MLEGKKAIVTGAAQGIGQAIAECLAKAGADVVVVDLDADRCADTLQLVESQRARGLALSANVGPVGSRQGDGRSRDEGMGPRGRVGE